MADKEKITLSSLKNAVQKGIASVDVDALKMKASDTKDVILEKANAAKDAAVGVKEDIERNSRYHLYCELLLEIAKNEQKNRKK